MKLRLFFFFAIGFILAACNENSDVTKITEEPIEVDEYFEFTIGDTDFELPEFRAWIEDHDSVTVTQIENFGSGIPEVIFNIHGTGTGTYELADFTILLDENSYSPHFFACKSCAVTSVIEYFGDEGDFVIGTFEGEVLENDTDNVYPISGKFSAIREN